VLKETLDGGFGDGARGIELGGGALGAGVDGEAVAEMPDNELIKLVGGEAGDAGDVSVFKRGAVLGGRRRAAADGTFGCGWFGRVLRTRGAQLVRPT